MVPLSTAPGLDPQAQWQRFCSLLWHNDAMGFWLDVSRMGLDAGRIEELRPRFAEAFKAMDALEGGAIANPDENRQVGHYWLRTPDLAPDPTSVQTHPAHVEPEAHRIVVPEQRAEALPLPLGIKSGSGGERNHEPGAWLASRRYALNGSAAKPFARPGLKSGATGAGLCGRSHNGAHTDWQL